MDIKQEFELIKQRSEKIKESAIKLNAEIEHNQREEERLKKELLAEFGSDNLEELEELVKSQDIENQAIYEKKLAQKEKLEQEVLKKSEIINSLKK